MMSYARGTKPKVLMLGWEYPPRFAGGLGKACQGFSEALARQGADVLFVLPTFQTPIREESLQVIGADSAPESLAAAGTSASAGRGLTLPSGLSFLSANVQLYPYGAHPRGPAPESLFRPFGRDALETMATTGTSGSGSSGSGPTLPRGQASDIYGRNLWSEIERFQDFARELAGRHQVDVVHAHDWMTFPAAFEFARLAKVPVFLHVHATEYDRSGEHARGPVYDVEREGFRKADHIFTVSRYTAEVIERFYQVDRRKVSVLYNAPERRPAAPAPSRAVTKSSSREKNVVFVGRLTFQKGPDHLLKAAALVTQRDPDVRFIFCGTGDLLPRLKQDAVWMGIEKQVRFTGFMEPSAVEKLLSGARVLVMPSVSEPFGLAALEAIDSGTPVILSKQSGVREVLHRSLQVDFWDHEKLADQIFAALRLKELSSQLVDEGRAQVDALSWDNSARGAMMAYGRHLQSNRPVHRETPRGTH